METYLRPSCFERVCSGIGAAQQWGSELGAFCPNRATDCKNRLNSTGIRPRNRDHIILLDPVLESCVTCTAPFRELVLVARVRPEAFRPAEAAD